MLLLKDFPADGSVIPFTSPDARIPVYIIAPELAISIMVDIIVIIALIKQQDIQIDTLFIVSLSIADLLFGVVTFVLCVGELIFSGFWAGKLGTLSQMQSSHSLTMYGRLSFD